LNIKKSLHSAHRLVLASFRGDADFSSHYVLHENKDPQDNRLENLKLAYKTRYPTTEKQREGLQSIRRGKPVRMTNVTTGITKCYHSMKEAAADIKVHPDTIRRKIR